MSCRKQPADSDASRITRVILVAALTLATALPAAAKTILVIGPHPDDEVLMGAGRMRQARVDGDVVKAVVVSNGDSGGLQSGYTRQGQSVAAVGLLGLSEQDVVFLGYSSSLLDMYRSSSGTEVFPGASGQTTTNGVRGLGGMDYHRYLNGVAGTYNRNTLLGDLRALLTNYRPDEVYTVSYFDAHPDHRAVGLFVVEALVGLKRSGLDLPTKVYQSIVWDPGTDWSATTWPYASGYGLGLPFPSPPSLGQTTLDWNQVYHFPVPPEMQTTDPATNLKLQAINQFGYYTTDQLRSFARKDEFFWLFDFGANLAVTATVSVSSVMWDPVQGAAKAINGIVDGDPHDYTMGWISGGGAGAWIQLDWPAPVTVAQVNLYDRPSATDNVVAGTLLFSDGSSVSVGALPPGGQGLPVSFSPRTVSWVRFRVDQFQGAVGLGEIEVLGKAATSTGNTAPRFTRGPVATPATITSGQTSTLSAGANDLEGGSVTYQWSVDAGSIQGNGPTAVFTPPSVSSSTVCTVTARISDSQGGSSSNSAFVTVTP